MRKRRQVASRTAQLRRLDALRPQTPDQLHRLIRLLTGVSIPREPLVPSNDAPFDYLLNTFFEGTLEPTRPGARDLIVWANRGGGKTYLGALATLLDMLFKPGIQVRILGGSLEQSGRMYEYLQRMVQAPSVAPLVAGKPTARRIALINGSAARVLSQSERSVRGQRVHKLRCDEVELFNPAVWDAAQRVTRSGRCGPVHVKGSIEALSTMHVPYGLMSRIIKQTSKDAGTKILRWCALDVAERCGPALDCKSCRLWDDCRGRAKQADGFIPIDDLIAQRHRSSDLSWDAEMMCKRPKRSHCVYPAFDPTVGKGHVRTVERPANNHVPNEDQPIIGGMDFGMRGATVMVWARVRPGGTANRPGIVEVFAEHFAEDLTLDQNIDRIEARSLPTPAWVGVDPAGCQRNSQTGLTDVDVLKRRGYEVRWCRSLVRDGISAIRHRIDNHSLVIDPSCEKLIEAITAYHFDPDRPHRQEPVKDGADHGCDALRYMIVNLDRPQYTVRTRNYL